MPCSATHRNGRVFKGSSMCYTKIINFSPVTFVPKFDLQLDPAEEKKSLDATIPATAEGSSTWQARRRSSESSTRKRLLEEAGPNYVPGKRRWWHLRRRAGISWAIWRPSRDAVQGVRRSHSELWRRRATRSQEKRRTGSLQRARYGQQN
jgi:hypothetical protein